MTRADLERAVERGIALLDLLDGDTDLEPSLGVYWSRGRWQTDDREREDELDEPSLSATLMLAPHDQRGTRWLGGGDHRDLEDQCEDEGAPTGDDEPAADADFSWPETGEHGQ